MYLVRCVFYGGATREKKNLYIFSPQHELALVIASFFVVSRRRLNHNWFFFRRAPESEKIQSLENRWAKNEKCYRKKNRRRHLKSFWVFPPVPQSVSGRVNIAKYICVSGENEKFIYNTIWERGMRGNEKKMLKKNWIVLSSYHRCLLNHVESITTCWEVGNAI